MVGSLPLSSELELSRFWVHGITGTGPANPFAGKEECGVVFQTLPISFKYDGQDSATILNSWRRSYEKKNVNEDITLHVLTYADPKTGLECRFELKEYHDFPAVDWVVKFKNTGKLDTPILEDIRSLDFSWRGVKKPTLYYSKGSDAKIDDFLYQSREFTENMPVVLGSVGGRSSCGTLPFFNVAMPEGGVLVAVGWTGQWSADIAFDGNMIWVRAGMEKTHLKLHPGEEIRTPSSLLLFWNGKETIRGNNLLRRLILKHYTYRPDGKTIPAPITVEHWGGMKTQRHLERLELYEKLNFDYDYYWIDAGWYGPKEDYCPDVFTGGWANYVGYWDYNPTPHPNGLRPISDAVHAKGKKFLLWFEPERAVGGTPWTKEHPEWFLDKRNKEYESWLLFNLGIPEARQWLTDEISKRITAWGVDCYRQDFNMEILPYWREADAPDRQGIAEIRHIEGLYAFWDELLRRHPGLMIDNCASGGRRIDIETTRRSIPLWRSDYQCYAGSSPTGTQVEFFGLSHWIPCHTVGTMKRPGDTYNFRSAMGAGVVFQMYECEYEVPDPNNPHDWHRRMLADQRRALPYYLGDYYPLKEGTVSSADWLAYQMHREDLAAGVVMVYRREDSPFSAGAFRLKAMEEGATYEVEDADTGKVETYTGTMLQAGLTVALEEKRTARLMFYRKK